MKELEFYQRAAADAPFRRAQLEELGYFKQVGVGLLWFCVMGAVLSIYGGFTVGEWDKGFGFLVVAALCASTYATCRSLMAALQALDGLGAQPTARDNALLQ